MGILFLGQAPQADSLQFALGAPGRAGVGGNADVNDGIDGIAADAVDTASLNEPDS